MTILGMYVVGAAFTAGVLLALQSRPPRLTWAQIIVTAAVWFAIWPVALYYGAIGRRPRWLQ